LFYQYLNSNEDLNKIIYHVICIRSRKLITPVEAKWTKHEDGILEGASNVTLFVHLLLLLFPYVYVSLLVTTKKPGIPLLVIK
jgi:hypothetical protein